MRHTFFLATLAGAVLASGCASVGTPWVESVRSVVDGGGAGRYKDAVPAVPDLRYRYLRVQLQGHPPTLLAQSYTDAHPQGPISVWYSSGQEVLRLQNGRIVGMTGTLYDWLGVRFSPTPVEWTAIPVEGSTFVRQRDQMPGYRFAITEQISVRPWQGLPPVDLPDTLTPAKAMEYRWYRESSTVLAGQGAVALPDAWFAWGKHRGDETIVYSEQCLAPDFCLKLQRWPLLEEAK